MREKRKDTIVKTENVKQSMETEDKFFAVLFLLDRHTEYAAAKKLLAARNMQKHGKDKGGSPMRKIKYVFALLAALLALTSANILFPGLSLAVFVLSSMPVLLMMIGLIAGLIPMFFCLLMALAALLRVGGAMLLGFGALYLLPMTAVYVYCLLRRQPFWHSCAALALALSGALTVIYALVQGMTGGQLYAAAGDAVMQSLDGLAMRDSLLYTLHQMGLLSLPQAMRETALVAVEGGYAFSAEAAQELTLQCRTLVMSLLHGLLPALLVSGTATNVLTGMGLGIYFGRRAAQKRAFKRDEPEQDIPDLGMPELRYWHIPRPWGLRIGILAVGYLIMRLPVGDTLYLLGALMWQAFCVCFAVQGLAAINFNQHQRGTRKGWRVAAIIAAMTVSLFQSVLMIIGVVDQINNARGLRPALKPRDGGEE